MLINQLEEHFNAKDYHDTYTEELQKVIEKKPGASQSKLN
jgi:non-homologous end joining protein Ku